MSKHTSTLVVFMVAVVGTVLAALILNTVVVAVPAGPLPQLVQPQQQPAAPDITGGVPGVQAPGGPVFDCTGASEKYTRLASGLDVQREAIRRQDAYVKFLNQVSQDKSTEALEKTREFAKDQFLDEAKDLANEAMTLRVKVEALKAVGLNQEMRRQVLEEIKAIEDINNSISKEAKNQQVSAEYRRAFQNSGHDLMQHANALAKLMVDSGLAEKGAALLGPEGPLALKGALFLIDYTAADMEGFDALQQLQPAMDNLRTMQQQFDNIQDKMSSLQTNCLNKPTASNNPPDSTSLANASTSKPAASSLQPAKASSHTGAVLLLGGLGAAGAVAYAAGVAMKNQANGGGSCGSPPTNPLNDCSAGSPNCSAEVDAYSAFCKCNGYAGGLNTTTGACQN